MAKISKQHVHAVCVHCLDSFAGHKMFAQTIQVLANSHYSPIKLDMSAGTCTTVKQ